MATSQATIAQLLNLLQGSVDKFVEGLPEVQRQTYTRLLALLKELDVRGDTIQNSVRNIRLLGQIKIELDDLVLNDKYLNSVKEFVTAYGTVARLNDRYFSSVADRYSPPKMLAEVRKQAVNDAVASLTENGIGANYTDQIRDLIKTAVTSGGSYSDLAEKLRTTIIGTDEDAGKLIKYAKQVTTDGINQFNRTYQKAVTDDLGFKWFRYTGSNLKTTRPFCRAMTKPENEYFHISQVPDIVKGRLNSGEVSTQGMRQDTNSTNFFIYAGGYNCGHSIIPVPEALVPEAIRVKVTDNGGNSGQTISGGEGGFEFSHSFVSVRGNEVTQYKIDGGGYARVEKYADGYVVTNVIIDESNRRKGYAKELYMKLNKESVEKTGKTLQSIKPDINGLIELSSDGQKFWENLEKKGLAKKIGNRRWRFVK